MKTIARTLKEMGGDFSVSGTRRAQAPSNIRAGAAVRGSHDSILDDEASVNDKTKQDNDTLPKAVAVYVSDGKGKVLAVTRNIITRGPNPTDLNMPGGLVDPGEDPEDAAARELFEETSLIAHTLVPIYSGVSSGKLTTTYMVTDWSGEAKSSWEGDVSWQKPDALLKSTFGAYFREVLKSIRIF
jgi:8-oxo-dGTP pyrophosphatase MutT (NUDIX family)